jgi:hypothetical protein
VHDGKHREDSAHDDQKEEGHQCARS